MTPKHRVKPHVPPDCPREYHDDYIGRPTPRRSSLRWLVFGGLIVGVLVTLYLVLSGTIA